MGVLGNNCLRQRPSGRCFFGTFFGASCETDDVPIAVSDKLFCLEAPPPCDDSVTVARSADGSGVPHSAGMQNSFPEVISAASKDDPEDPQ